MQLIDVLRARRRIAPFVRRTPLVESSWLSDAARGRVWLKVESLQVSNSFKSRGAFNAVRRLRDERPSDNVSLVTASAGNHGRALAIAAERFALPLTVFTPADAPRAKVDAIRRHRAMLRAESRDYDEAERTAKSYAQEHGAVFVSPYNDLDVIAGAGTIALELFEEQPGLDTLVVPIGGGGLISGIAAAARAINPECRVIGVEAQASCAFQTSVRAGRLVEIVPGPTLADGLGGNPDSGTITFPLIQKFVHEIVTVTEDDIRRAIGGLLAHEHLVAEGAGAVPMAAVLAGLIDVANRSAALVLSGSNIDLTTLQGVLAALQQRRSSSDTHSD
jgi:threonine dehydratase